MIQIKDLTITYPDGKVAVSELNLTINDGETVAIVGANGAGKSSLLLSMVGVITPSSGTISLDGIEVNKKNISEIRAKIGIVFQNPDDLLFMTRVYDDIAFGPRNYDIPEGEVKIRVEKALKELNIEHLQDRSPHKLSGGEKRSVAIACVLSMYPSVLLLDEPSSFLDPQARRALLSTLRTLSLTKVIATHDMDMALELCDRVIVLKEGVIFADGNAKDILTDEKLMSESGLELPFCCQECNEKTLIHNSIDQQTST